MCYEGSYVFRQWVSRINLPKSIGYRIEKTGMTFEREQTQNIFYKDYPVPIGKRRVDFLVEGKILVELKAVSELMDHHLNQILNYLKAYKLEIGLLINFGEKSLKFNRLILSQKT